MSVPPEIRIDMWNFTFALIGLIGVLASRDNSVLVVILFYILGSIRRKGE